MVLKVRYKKVREITHVLYGSRLRNIIPGGPETCKEKMWLQERFLFRDAEGSIINADNKDLNHDRKNSGNQTKSIDIKMIFLSFHRE